LIEIRFFKNAFLNVASSNTFLYETNSFRLLKKLNTVKVGQKMKVKDEMELVE
jgi:hypothetical protein